MVEDIVLQRITGTLTRISYHQYHLVTRDPEDEFPEGKFEDEIFPHTLVVPVGGLLSVTTGVSEGAILLDVEILRQAPSEFDVRSNWQAISDVSFRPNSPTAWIAVLMDPVEPPFDTAFALPDSMEFCRARVHASGRSLDNDLSVRVAREKHLIQLWSTPKLEASVHHRIDDRWASTAN